jgi:DNA-binding LytR/AlgR family response regulator
MNLNVLIVEDQFLEAENLSIILKNAGHAVHGIAKSVDQANGCVQKSLLSNSYRPECGII